MYIMPVSYYSILKNHKTMKKYIILLVLPVLLTNCTGPYTDGEYSGRSRSYYIEEPYVGMVKLYIKKGYITNIEFEIIDTLTNEIFDENYETHFSGNKEYTEQCRKDWVGVSTYPGELIKMQEIEKLDAISGATWSYNIFTAACKKALGKAINNEE